MKIHTGDATVARYRATANGDRDRPPITLLHIGEQETGIAVYGREPGPAAVIDLEIGDVRTPSEYFRRYPPSAAALENAIMVVEDEVARVRPLIASGSVLVTDDASIREIARVAGLADQPLMVLRIEAVEATFSRLVAASLGQPASGIPASQAFAGALLILREFMHHLDFSSISIV